METSINHEKDFSLTIKTYGENKMKLVRRSFFLPFPMAPHLVQNTVSSIISISCHHSMFSIMFIWKSSLAWCYMHYLIQFQIHSIFLHFSPFLSHTHSGAILSHLFTYIYSLLVEKDICDCVSVSQSFGHLQLYARWSKMSHWDFPRSCWVTVALWGRVLSLMRTNPEVSIPLLFWMALCSHHKVWQ
jgi:hypothetical protein